MKVKRFLESVEEKEHSEGQKILIYFLNQLFSEFIKVELLDVEYNITGYDLFNKGDTWTVFYGDTMVFSIVEDGKFYDLDEIWHRQQFMSLISVNSEIVSKSFEKKIKEDII